MPLALVVIGLALVLVGVRNTYGDFASTLKGEFTGPDNFGKTAGAIIMIGVIGYAGEGARKLSVAMLVLFTAALLVTRNSGFFTQLGKALATSPVKPTADTGQGQGAVTPTSGTSPSTGSTDRSATLQQGANAVKSFLPLLAMFI